MAHSIELRVPLVDTTLVRRIGPRARPQAGLAPKRLLALAPRRALPKAILDRPKTGFETPVGDWMRAQGARHESWARGWARRIVSQRLDRRSMTAAFPGRVRVTHLQRRAAESHFSIERLYEDVRAALANDDAVDVGLRINDYPSRGLLARIADVRRAGRVDADVLHVNGDVHYLALGLDPRRTVLTVHDCVSLHRLHGWQRAVFKKLWYDWPVRRARWITVISEFTRRELAEQTGCDPDRIVVIPNHVSDEFIHVPKAFNSARPRVLQIGTKPNKNLERVVEALGGLPLELVVVGELTAAQKKLLDTCGLVFEHHRALSRERLLVEYQRCDLVAFVSTYEGFGLPILEAQATGRPVVTSTVCSMPEVAGEGAVTVDPHDVDAIRAAFQKLIDDPAHRDAVVEAGLRNVERYRLPVVAGMYRDLYRRAGEIDGAAA
jgi:glycosyltransferase involved in cell wall biosynthesis